MQSTARKSFLIVDILTNSKKTEDNENDPNKLHEPYIDECEFLINQKQQNFSIEIPSKKINRSGKAAIKC